MDSKARGRKFAKIALWVVGAVVFIGLAIVIGSWLNAALERIAEPEQRQGQTVAYNQDGQGTEGVPVFDVPGHQTGQQLPNFTAVDMLCWEDQDDIRWFYVRIGPESDVSPSQVVVLRADDVINQARVDRC